MLSSKTPFSDLQPWLECMQDPAGRSNPDASGVIARATCIASGAACQRCEGQHRACVTVAVGTPVTRRPPHRSRRAALPHRAPASGLTCWHPQMPAVRGRARVTGITRPCVRSLVCTAAFPLASSLPSTSSAGSLGQPLFEGFLGTMELSDSLHPCITVVSRGCTVRTWHHCQARCRASRVPHTVFSRMLEVSDPAGCGDALP
jgi:hypothetical protein